MRIGLLGGTFDPIHLGHLHLADEAKSQLALDKIFLIPAYLPPHKENGERTPAAMRLEMARLALDGKPALEASDVEIRKKSVSYTIDTLRILHASYPEGTEFFFLTGSDSLEILDQWKEVREIFKLATFVVAKRPGFEKRWTDYPIRWLEIEPLDISSSEIRKRVREGREIHTLVPQKVADYIRRHRLYRGDS